jgi:hypothetical protein
MPPIKKLIYALLIGLLLSSICSFLLSKGLKKYYVEQNKKYEKTFADSSYFDILFVGSSRVHNNINPKIVDSITKLKSFNAGTDGANLFESKIIIESFLENHPAPKKILLCVDLFSFNTKNKLFNYTYYLPFAKNKKIASVLSSLDHNTSLYNYFPFLQMADYDDYAKTNALKGYVGKTELGKNQNQYEGFVSLGNETLQTDKVNIPTETVFVDTTGTKALQDILLLCNKNNIKLNLFYAPEYKAMWQKKVTNAYNIFNIIDSFSQKNQLPFLRYDENEICNNAQYFNNVRHLNNDGANVFSRIVGEDIVK